MPRTLGTSASPLALPSFRANGASHDSLGVQPQVWHYRHSAPTAHPMAAWGFNPRSPPPQPSPSAEGASHDCRGSPSISAHQPTAQNDRNGTRLWRSGSFSRYFPGVETPGYHGMRLWRCRLASYHGMRLWRCRPTGLMGCAYGTGDQLANTHHRCPHQSHTYASSHDTAYLCSTSRNSF